VDLLFIFPAFTVAPEWRILALWRLCPGFRTWDWHVYNVTIGVCLFDNIRWEMDGVVVTLSIWVVLVLRLLPVRAELRNEKDLCRIRDRDQ
jgi:hypothetical protein